MNLFLRHMFDDTLLLGESTETSIPAAFGPYGSHYTLLDRYMSFTDRAERLPIRVAGQDQIMECIDAITRLTGRKLFIYICAHPVVDTSWEVMLTPIDDISSPVIIQFIYAGDIQELEVFLRVEGYIVNDIGVHP